VVAANGKNDEWGEWGGSVARGGEKAEGWDIWLCGVAAASDLPWWCFVVEGGGSRKVSTVAGCCRDKSTAPGH
jgi:hypothetical protein